MNFKFSWRVLDLVNPLYWLAFIWWLGQQARRKTYRGFWPGLVTWPLALAFSIAALITTKHFVGDVNGYSWVVWLPSSLFSAWVVEMFLWPFAFSVSDKVGELIGKVTGGIAEKVLPAVVNGLKNLPGASAAWSHAEDDKKRKWFTGFVMGLSYVTGFLASAYIGGQTALFARDILSGVFASGWFATTWLGEAMAGVPVLGFIASVLDTGFFGALLGGGWILGGFVGFVAFRLVIQPVFDVMEKGKLPGVASVAGVLVAYFVHGLIGGPSVAALAAAVASFVVFTAWLFPLTLLFFNEGLKRFGEWIKPLLESVYDADESDWRKLFHHVVNIIVAVGLTAGAYILGSSMAWPLFVTAPFALLVLVVSYLTVVKAIEHSGGNAIVGVLSSLGVGLGTYFTYTTSVGLFGWLGGVFAAALGALVFGLLVFPAFYRLIQFVFSGITRGGGDSLEKAHKSIYETVKNLHKKVFEKAQKATFEDKTDFKPLFGQVANVLFSAGVFVTAYVYGVSAVESNIGWWCALAGAAIVSHLVYLTGGRLAGREGGEALIVLLSLGAAAYVGASAFIVLPWTWWLSLPTAVVLAIIAGYGVALYVLPPIYAVLKAVVNAIPDKEGGWKKSIADMFEKMHKLFWTVFDTVVWTPLGKAVAAVAEFMAPIVAAINRRWRALMDRIDRIFNKNKTA